MFVCVRADIYIYIYKHVYMYIYISALSQPAALPCQGRTGRLLVHSEGLALRGEGARGRMWLGVLWRGAFGVYPASFPSSLPAREEPGVLARPRCSTRDPRAQVTTALGAGGCEDVPAGTSQASASLAPRPGEGASGDLCVPECWSMCVLQA